MRHVVEFLQKNVLTISIQVVGFLVVVLNLWLSNKLIPLAEDTQRLSDRVSAIELDIEKSNAMRERFIVVETKEEEIIKDIKELKESFVRLENKVDRLIERLQ